MEQPQTIAEWQEYIKKVEKFKEEYETAIKKKNEHCYQASEALRLADRSDPDDLDEHTKHLLFHVDELEVLKAIYQRSKKDLATAQKNLDKLRSNKKN